VTEISIKITESRPARVVPAQTTFELSKTFIEEALREALERKGYTIKEIINFYYHPYHEGRKAYGVFSVTHHSS
jgi:Icc-related predicted phosphoesterase